MSGDARWIYNDVDRGFEKARNSGNPLLVILRCVPCLACGGLDGRVIDRSTDLASLLDQFVCVRVINANALDLSRFEFDYDRPFQPSCSTATGPCTDDSAPGSTKPIPRTVRPTDSGGRWRVP
jgi:hypothetical protein